MADNYVRFLRGTPAAFEKVVQKDVDTLYFISEKNAENGTLYLGNKLIGGNGLISDISLSQLKDINISGTDSLASNSILVYNAETEKWEVKEASAFTSSEYYVMTGATETLAGRAGFVPAPAAGDQNAFLKGDGTWSNPVSNLESKLNKLVGEDSEKTIREIAVDAIQKAFIPENAKETLDTLEEISGWIQTHSDVLSDGDLVSKVGDLEKIILDSKNSETGETIPGLQSIVSTLETKIVNIEERLIWQDLPEE